ncbi:MAG: hypothetical protein L0H93_02865 [Nocardioides sp.]|nr:hypothetical protein [Nocardioides sp.]
MGEALASGSGSHRACEVAGRGLAQDGVSLDEVLIGLGETCRAVTGREPDFGDIRAASRAWSEATLAYLHQLSCEDPLTGLASLAHIRSRLSELYRGQLGGAGPPDETHALVVLDLSRAHLPGGPDGTFNATFDRALRLARLGESARTVFAGSEPIGRSGADRVIVVAERSRQLGRQVALVRTLVEPSARVWIEGLPSSDDSAALLLDELCRH